MKYWRGPNRLWVWTWCLGLGWVGAVGQTLPGAAEAPGAKRPVARVEDANGNGKVDKGERKAALESWQARRRQQQQKAETEAKAAVRQADENVKRQQQKVSATLLEK